eukprot:PhF_6_TR27845/c0_g1_i1/m.40650
MFRRGHRIILAHYTRSTQDITQQLTRINKHKPDKRILSPLLDEFIQRAQHLPSWAVSQAATMGRIAGLSDKVLEVFLNRSASVNTHDASVTLYDGIVDCAFDSRKSLTIVKCVNAVKPVVETTPNDIVSRIAICRAIWRCMSLYRHDPDNYFKSAQYILEFAKVVVPGLKDGIPDDTAFLKQVQRLAMYGNVDQGEMKYYKLLYDIVFSKGAETVPNSDSNISSSSGGLSSHITLSLIKSCEKGEWSDQATEYYNVYKAKKGAVEESLLVAWCHVLNHAKQHHIVIAAIQELLELKYVPSTSVLGVVVNAATHAGDPSIVRRCFDVLLSSPPSSGGATAEDTTASSAAPIPVQSVLLCLQALARLGAPDFEEILDTCIQNKLLSAENQGVIIGLLLSWASKSIHPEATLTKLEPLMNTETFYLTEDIANALLHIYSKLCDDRLYDVYLTMQRRGVRKLFWAIFLLNWADSKRYSLTPEQRQFIVREAEYFQLQRNKAVENIVQCLQYDLAHDPFNHFDPAKNVFPAPPTFMDSKDKFLRRSRLTVTVPSVLDENLEVCRDDGGEEIAIANYNDAVAGARDTQKGREYVQKTLRRILKEIQKGHVHLAKPLISLKEVQQ